MPIIGQILSDKMVAELRKCLEAQLASSSKLKALFPDSMLFLTRRVYTGDYILRGVNSGSFFPIAKFGMLPLPGCHSICVFYHSEVTASLRGKGIGKELLRIRMTAAKAAGYKMALATVAKGNQVEWNLLCDMGWIFMMGFEGNKGHDVSLFMRAL